MFRLLLFRFAGVNETKKERKSFYVSRKTGWCLQLFIFHLFCFFILHVICFLFLLFPSLLYFSKSNVALFLRFSFPFFILYQKFQTILHFHSMFSIAIFVYIFYIFFQISICSISSLEIQRTCSSRSNFFICFRLTSSISYIFSSSFFHHFSNTKLFPFLLSQALFSLYF